MYILFGLFLVLAIVCYILFYFRRQTIIRRVCNMEHCKKTALLNELLEPFGFTYLTTQDIISSTTDAWQRRLGYHALFDHSAPHFNMVFDCEPIYFDYDGRTWLIELWKGQYGINIGAEVGIYHADTLINPSDYDTTHFDSATDEEMMPVSVVLFRNADPEILSEICCRNCDCPHSDSAPVPLFWISRRHWWLTGFCMGQYSHPSGLALRAAITFPDCHMQQSFLQGLIRTGYPECDIKVHDLTVSFLFSVPYTAQPSKRHPLGTWAARIKNRFFCLLYLHITKPFTATCDRLLYLYYFLPQAFRHTLKFKRNRKQRHQSYRKRG